MTATGSGKRPWYVEWYGAPGVSAAQQVAERAAMEQRFRALYPDRVWDGMSPAEQAYARATWLGQQELVAAARESGRLTRSTLWVVFVVIPIVLVCIGVVVTLIASGG